MPDGEMVVGYDRSSAYFVQIVTIRGKLSIEHASSIEALIALCKPHQSIPNDVLASLINERAECEYIAGLSASLGKTAGNSSDLNATVKRNFHLVEVEDASAYFDDMKQRFLECTSAYDMALCATYSLSDSDIIQALGKMRYVSVLTDRKQYDEHCDRKVEYRTLIDHRGVPSNPIDSIEIFNDGKDPRRALYESLKAFNVVDLASASRFESFHTKFCVFCDVLEHPAGIAEHIERLIVPKAVWVGSYNPTPTGDRSIQASVLLRNRKIVLAFMSEYYALYRTAENAGRKPSRATS